MRRILSMILVLTLVLSLGVTAYAAEGSFDRFSVTAPEVYDRFTDIDQSKWYGSEQQGVIQTACELGILNGMGPTQFLPEGKLRINEAVKIACMVHSIYYGTQETLQGLSGGKNWAKPYMAYAVENGILPEGTFADGTAYATRAQMAALFACCLPEEGLEQINPVGAIVDVASTMTKAVQYAEEIFTLYRAGVLTGDEESHAFRPTETITRAEAAAIVVRLVVPEERVHFEIFDPYGFSGASPEFGVVDQEGRTLHLEQQPYTVLEAFMGSEPLKKTVHEAPSYFGEKSMLFVTEIYDGVEIKYWMGTLDPVEISVISIKLTGPGVKTLNGLEVGDSNEALLAAYEENELIYEPSCAVGDFGVWTEPNYHHSNKWDEFPWNTITFTMDGDTTYIKEIHLA